MKPKTDPQLDDEDGEAWAKVYISALSTPGLAHEITPSELAAYAHAVADRYIAFRRAVRSIRHPSRIDVRTSPPRWRDSRDIPR